MPQQFLRSPSRFTTIGRAIGQATPVVANTVETILNDISFNKLKQEFLNEADKHQYTLSENDKKRIAAMDESQRDEFERKTKDFAQQFIDFKKDEEEFKIPPRWGTSYKEWLNLNKFFDDKARLREKEDRAKKANELSKQQQERITQFVSGQQMPPVEPTAEDGALGGPEAFADEAVGALSGEPGRDPLQEGLLKGAPAPPLAPLPEGPVTAEGVPPAAPAPPVQAAPPAAAATQPVAPEVEETLEDFFLNAAKELGDIPVKKLDEHSGFQNRLNAFKAQQEKKQQEFKNRLERQKANRGVSKNIVDQEMRVFDKLNDEKFDLSSEIIKHENLLLKIGENRRRANKGENVDPTLVDALRDEEGFDAAVLANPKDQNFEPTFIAIENNVKDRLRELKSQLNETNKSLSEIIRVGKGQIFEARRKAQTQVKTPTKSLEDFVIGR